MHPKSAILNPWPRPDSNWCSPIWPFSEISRQGGLKHETSYELKDLGIKGL